MQDKKSPVIAGDFFVLSFPGKMKQEDTVNKKAPRIWRFSRI
jgi:hypothetical protein